MRHHSGRSPLADCSSFVASSGLQVFRKEAHPSVYKAGGGGAKEGLSLFGMSFLALGMFC